MSRDAMAEWRSSAPPISIDFVKKIGATGDIPA